MSLVEQDRQQVARAKDSESWLGKPIQVTLLDAKTTITGKLLAVSPVTHRVTLLIGDDLDHAAEVVIRSDHPVTKPA